MARFARGRCLAWALVLPLTLAAPAAAQADPFGERIQPFLQAYCYECHGPTKAEAELNLARYTSAAMLADDFRQWNEVRAFLESEEMPPAEAEKHPTAEERAVALRTLDEVMSAEAGKLAGDPGDVLPRRLSNAEYNNTIRDLTGVDIRPADAFPVDPASGEGFSNTGEALQMSAALFKQQFAAAGLVADHVDFTPGGWSFAPYSVATYADQKKLHEQTILDFYRRHDVRYDVYLAAAWRYRHRTAERQSITIDQWADEHELSPKYLHALWDLLEAAPGEQHFYAAWLRRRWQAVPAPDPAAAGALPAEAQERLRTLAKDLSGLGAMLCPVETPPIVAHAGNAPIQHLERRKQTAAAHDTFNAALLGDARHFRLELGNLAKKDVVRVVLHVAPAEPAPASDVLVLLSNLNFSTAGDDYKPGDTQRNVALMAVLKDHAPAMLERLQASPRPRPEGIDPDSIALWAPATIELEIPAAALPQQGTVRLHVDARLDRQHTPAGAGRFALLDHLPQAESLGDLPFPLVNPEHGAADELRRSCAALCEVFPNRFYYADETRGLSAGFHLIEGFFRDDGPLCRRVLDDDQRRDLDRLWEELSFGTHIAEKMLRGFVFFERSERNFMKHPDFDGFREEDPDLVQSQSLERLEQVYLARSGVKATGAELAEHPIHLFFADIRAGLERRAQTLSACRPAYQAQLDTFAESAYRRPLTAAELKQLHDFLDDASRRPELGLEGALRASIVRILVSPYFCLRLDPAPPGETVAPLPDLALASRLSYFLWASMPDAELMSVAKAGRLHEEEVLRAQTRRMLRDPKVAGMALEFFGPWLRYRDFLQTAAASRTAFPKFDDALKQAMFEEPTRLASLLVQQNRSVLDLLAGDSTCVNKRLAEHYGLPFSGPPGSWCEATGLGERGRGGLLGMAVFLTKNSQPERTSPVKRGFWVVHHLLDQHIPPPPPGVVALPAKETDTSGKTIRQLLAAHTEEARCANCHRRFDALGLAMEGFDAIGGARGKDLAGRPIDNLVELPSGRQARGVPELAQYLASDRADQFTQTLGRKLLGYALGRSLLLSDRPLLERLQARLKQNDYRFGELFETIVASPQFRNERCQDFTAAAFRNERSGE